MKRTRKRLTANERTIRAIRLLDLPGNVYFDEWIRHTITCPAVDKSGECHCVPEVILGTPLGLMDVLPCGRYRPRCVLN